VHSLAASSDDLRPSKYLKILPAPSNTCPNPVFDVMSTANSPHGAAGASPPHQDVLNSKKAVKFADLQFSGVSCRDISDLPVQWCWSNTSEMRYMRYHLVVRRCSKPRSCQCILWRHLKSRSCIASVEGWISITGGINWNKGRKTSSLRTRQQYECQL
jgi:hypothetical protein